MAAFSKLTIIGVKMTKSDKIFASLKMSSCVSDERVLNEYNLTKIDNVL